MKGDGFQFGIHNHAWEWEPCDGVPAIQWTLEPTSPDVVKFELDTFHTWETHTDPEEYIKRFADRIELLHFKDGTREGQTEFGHGDLNFARYRDAGEAAGVRYFILEYGPQHEDQVDRVADGYQRAAALCTA